MLKLRLLSLISIFFPVLFLFPILQARADISTGLVGHWKLDETSGTTASDSIGSSNGTLINGPTWTSGKLGGALNLDGVNDYVNIGDVDLSNAYTISAWVNLNTLPSVNAMILAKDFQTYQLLITPTGRIVFQRNSMTSLSYNAGITAGTWRMITFSFNSSSGSSLYLDGNFALSSTTDRTINNVNNVVAKIGSTGYTPKNFWNGLIDDVRIYNRALSAADVAELYNYTGGSSSSSSSVSSSGSSLSSSSSVSAPTVSTVAASNITSTSAALNGTINPNGTAVTVYFQYGTVCGVYGSQTATQTFTGTTASNFSINIANLSPNTSYCYRAVATNSGGTVYGNGVTFTTLTMTSSSSSSLSSTSSSSGPNTWQSVPLRTAVQKSAGIAGGEGMQMIFGIAYAPSNPQIAYLVNDTSFVWKSVDGGKTWVPKHRGAKAKGGVSIAVDPNNENRVFVAGTLHSASNPFTSSSVSDGIYRSTDGGDTWALIRPTTFYRLTEAKRGTNFAFSGTGAIYAGTYSEGILKSIDNGATWTSLGSLPGVGSGLGNEVMDIKIHPQDNSVLFVATRSGLYKVTDTGTAAQVVKLGAGLPFNADTNTNPNDDNFPRSVVIDSANPLILIVSNGRTGVHKSTDGGVTFAAKNTGIIQLTQSASTITSSLAMSPVNPQKLYLSLYGAGGRNIYYSNNGAESWSQTSVVDPDGYMSDLTSNSNQGTSLSATIAPHPSNPNIALSRGAGTNAVIRTDDGGQSWVYSGSGYTGGAFAGIGWDRNDANRFVVFLIDHGPEMTIDGGGTFKKPNLARSSNGLTTAAGALEPITDTDYAHQVIVSAVGGWTDQIITVSRDGGNSWTNFPVDKDGNSTMDDYDDAIYFHPQNANIIYAGQFKSLDKGVTWFRIPRKVLAVYPTNGEIVYSALADTSTPVRTTVYKSVDGGNTWNAPYGTFTGNFREIRVSPDNQNRIYASVWAGVNIWTGSQWETKNSANGIQADQFGALNVYGLAIDSTHPNVVYAGKFAAGQGFSNGVFRSQDYGQTWENISYNLGTEFNTWHLEVNPHDGYVYVGSPHGTWKLPPPYSSSQSSSSSSSQTSSSSNSSSSQSSSSSNSSQSSSSSSVAPDVISPLVAVTFPTANSVYSTTQSTVNISGIASDNVSVSSVSWLNSTTGASGTAVGTDMWAVSNIALVSGSNLITVIAKDAAGNSSNDIITVSYTPAAVPSVTTNSATNITQTSATLRSVVNPNNLTTTVYFEYGTQVGSYPLRTSSRTITGSSNTAVNMDVTALSANTTYYYRAVASNLLGSVNGNQMSFSTLSLPDISAPIGSVSINNNASQTTSANVVLNLSASDNTGVVGYYISENSATPSHSQTGWTTVISAQNFSDTISFSLSSGNGNKTVYVWYKDSSNNVSIASSDSIRLQSGDLNKPTSKVKIKKSDGGLLAALMSIFSQASTEETNISHVILSLSSKDDSGVVGYYVSESSAVPLSSDSGWAAINSSLDYNQDISFILSSGNGIKTVYGFFKDDSGNISDPSSDSITLNVHSDNNNGNSGGGGGGTIATNKKSPSSFSVKSPKHGLSITTDKLTFEWEVSSDNDLAQYQLFLDGMLVKDNIKTNSFTVQSSVSCGNHSWYVRAKDQANNQTDTVSASFIRKCQTAGGQAESSSFGQNSIITDLLFYGIKSEQVRILQKMLSLDKTVYSEGVITGYYGPLTLASVKRFQKKYGLDPTGAVDIKTKNKLNEIYGKSSLSQYSAGQASAYLFSREFGYGAKGNDVLELQKRLTSAGVYTGPITGYYGPLTREAVKKYQIKNNLPSVGAVGPRTRFILNNQSSSVR